MYLSVQFLDVFSLYYPRLGAQGAADDPDGVREVVRLLGGPLPQSRSSGENCAIFFASDLTENNDSI